MVDSIFLVSANKLIINIFYKKKSYIINNNKKLDL